MGDQRDLYIGVDVSQRKRGEIEQRLLIESSNKQYAYIDGSHGLAYGSRFRYSTSSARSSPLNKGTHEGHTQFAPQFGGPKPYIGNVSVSQ